MTISDWRKVWESPTLITHQNNKIQHLVIRVNKLYHDKNSEKYQLNKDFMWHVTRADGDKIKFIGQRTNKKSAASLAFEYMMENKK